MKKITSEQAQALRLLADGWTYDRIAMIIWGCANEDGSVDHEKLNRKKRLLADWFRDPKLKEQYNEIIRSELLPPIKKIMLEKYYLQTIRSIQVEIINKDHLQIEHSTRIKRIIWDTG